MVTVRCHSYGSFGRREWSSQDSIVATGRWRGWLGIAATMVSLLCLAGCTPYPDGAVARRAEAYVVRSQCPAGSAPQVTSVKVWVLSADPQGPSGTAEPTLPVDEQLVWAAHAKDRAAAEIALFKDSDDVDVTANLPVAIAAGTWVQLEICTLTSSVGGTRFRWGDIEVGQADVQGDRMPEADIPAPEWSTGVRC